MSSLPRKSQNCNVAVIGAGVIGLSTAICIQETIENVDVTIYADKFCEETLSYGAGGLFRPEISIDPKSDNVIKWTKSSIEYFVRLANTSDAKDAGIRLVSGYHLSSSTEPRCHNKLLQSLVPLYRTLTEEEMKLFPKSFKHGIFYTTVVADCRYYLSWLQKKFTNRGGKVEKRHIEKLSEIDGFDIIVNCTGLGAKELVNDKLLIPIRGQTIKVKAPWINNFYYGDEVYVIPGIDYVTLGGIKDYGSWNTIVNNFQKQFIWDKCVELVPSLKDAEILWDWVGLRPYRSAVCLECCLIQCDGKDFKVVNNYGHGGHGITLSWGTAQHAAKLVNQLINTPNFLLISRL